MSSPTTAPVSPRPDSDVYDELRSRVDGPLARPGDPLFATLVSPWNLAVDIRPDAVLAARTANDVVEAVRFAGRNGLTVTPQATGHGPIASLVGHLLVTTGGLDECTVHPEGWARVGAGVKWLKVIRAAAPHGLAPLSGSISDVGVAGYTTGGGLGPMARTYGLASDRVRAFEVVTGDGELRRATPTEHPELYFGLRGGKGALGIVTAIEFDLVHRPTFHGGALWFDGADAARVMAAWQDWAETLPEEATTSIALFRLPPLPDVPPVLAEKLTVSVRYVWAGDPEEGARHIDPMREVAPILVDDVSRKPYLAIDSVHTDPLDPMPSLEMATTLSAFPASAAAALLDVAGPDTASPLVLVEVRQVGGATAREPEHDSAFCARGAAFAVLAVGIPDIPGTAEGAAAVIDAVRPWTGPYLMPNFTFSAEDLASAYDPPTLERLRRAVATYDPAGVMALGRNLR